MKSTAALKANGGVSKKDKRWWKLVYGAHCLDFMSALKLSFQTEVLYKKNCTIYEFPILVTASILPW